MINLCINGRSYKVKTNAFIEKCSNAKYFIGEKFDNLFECSKDEEFNVLIDEVFSEEIFSYFVAYLNDEVLETKKIKQNTVLTIPKNKSHVFWQNDTNSIIIKTQINLPYYEIFNYDNLVEVIKLALYFECDQILKVVHCLINSAFDVDYAKSVISASLDLQLNFNSNELHYIREVLWEAGKKMKSDELKLIEETREIIIKIMDDNYQMIVKLSKKININPLMLCMKNKIRENFKLIYKYGLSFEEILNLFYPKHWLDIYLDLFHYAKEIAAYQTKIKNQSNQPIAKNHIVHGFQAENFEFLAMEMDDFKDRLKSYTFGLSEIIPWEESNIVFSGGLLFDILTDNKSALNNYLDIDLFISGDKNAKMKTQNRIFDCIKKAGYKYITGMIGSVIYIFIKEVPRMIQLVFEFGLKNEEMVKHFDCTHVKSFFDGTRLYSYLDCIYDVLHKRSTLYTKSNMLRHYKILSRGLNISIPREEYYLSPDITHRKIFYMNKMKEMPSIKVYEQQKKIPTSNMELFDYQELYPKIKVWNNVEGISYNGFKPAYVQHSLHRHVFLLYKNVVFTPNKNKINLRVDGVIKVSSSDCVYLEINEENKMMLLGLIFNSDSQFDDLHGLSFADLVFDQENNLFKFSVDNSMKKYHEGEFMSFMIGLSYVNGTCYASEIAIIEESMDNYKKINFEMMRGFGAEELLDDSAYLSSEDEDDESDVSKKEYQIKDKDDESDVSKKEYQIKDKDYESNVSKKEYQIKDKDDESDVSKKEYQIKDKDDESDVSKKEYQIKDKDNESGESESEYFDDESHDSK
jgi:hypothetical protein